MNYEERIRELTERIEKLEKAENKRVFKKRATIITKVTVILVIVLGITFGSYYVNKTYIKPYKEKIDYVTEKVDTIQSFIDDKLGSLKKYGLFN